MWCCLCGETTEVAELILWSEERIVRENKLYTTPLGSVILARDLITGQRLVIKENSLELIEQRRHKYHENPYLEYHWSTFLPKHSHILPVLGTYTDDESFHLIRPYCEKGDLYEYIMKDHGLKEPEIHSLFKQICSGVQHIHQHDLVHLDLSAENIVLDQNTCCYITDFGQARQVLPQPFPAERFRGPGKIFYMAPEIYAGQEFDGKSADMFSLGVLLFVMYFASYPFEAPTLNCNNFRYLYTNGASDFLQKLHLTDRICPEARDLMNHLLCPPEVRWTINQVLQQTWLNSGFMVPVAPSRSEAEPTI